MNVYNLIAIMGALMAMITLMFVKEDTKTYGVLLTISMLMIIVPFIVLRIDIIRHLV